MMNTSKPIRTVLLVGAEQETFDRLEPLLRRASFDVDRVPTAESAEVLLQAVSFDVIILSHPLPDRPLPEVMDIIRAPGAPCRRSAVLILAAPAACRSLSSYGQAARTTVLEHGAPRERLEQEVAALLRVAPRLSIRIPIRLEVELADGRTSVISQTENVSLGGMLVRTRRLYPVETAVRFELLIPDETSGVAGRGLVVRQTDERKDGVRGVGVKFNEFKGAGRERLASFLNRRDDQSHVQPPG